MGVCSSSAGERQRGPRGVEVQEMNVYRPVENVPRLFCPTGWGLPPAREWARSFESAEAPDAERTDARAG